MLTFRALSSPFFWREKPKKERSRPHPAAAARPQKELTNKNKNAKKGGGRIYCFFKNATSKTSSAGFALYTILALLMALLVMVEDMLDSYKMLRLPIYLFA